ncbi:nSTAND3 domain-containing NTPase [Lysobacter sp. P5_B9]
MEYDFSVLNDRDFEILANDLLSKHFGEKIERFKPGKDKGVDGRWFSASGEVVLQYKNWSRSGVEKLISHLAGDELKKIKKLSPERYIVATSVQLSRANKERIKKALHPYIQSEGDIFGREDLHDLLVSSPEIEMRNPKLWVATGRVLSQIINHGLVGRSGFAMEEIHNFARRYVDTADAERARVTLDRARVLIIKGAPGVGKTTLAHELLLEAAGRGFVPYVLNSIEEAESIFDGEVQQFFLFDDFLGSNLLEVIRGREDAKIVGFLRRVAARENKRFVLTSRSHILEQGKDCSELFRIEKISTKEFELSVGHLSRLEKAKILYAHIWAGGMPTPALDAIYESNRYMDVISHRNFNPRLVAFITDPDRIAGLAKEEYWAYVERSFEYPSEIWDHVFRKQVSVDTKDLAYLVGFNGRPISDDELKNAFRRYSYRVGESDPSFYQRFHDALKLAIGSVLTRVVDREGMASLSLFNPSIGDYLLAEAPRLGVLHTVFASLVTASSLNYLDSLVQLEVVSESDRLEVFMSMIAPPSAVFDMPLNVAVAVVGRLLRLDVPWHDISAACRTVALRVNSDMGDALEDGLLVLSKAFVDHPKELLPVLDRLMQSLDEVLVSIKAMRHLCTVAKLADEAFGGNRYQVLREEIVSIWRDNIGQFVSDDSILADLYDENDLGFAEDQVYDYVYAELSSIGLEVDAEMVMSIATELDVSDVLNSNLEAAADRWEDDGRDSFVTSYSPDAEIHDYFERS